MIPWQGEAAAELHTNTSYSYLLTKLKTIGLHSTALSVLFHNGEELIHMFNPNFCLNNHGKWFGSQSSRAHFTLLSGACGVVGVRSSDKCVTRGRSEQRSSSRQEEGGNGRNFHLRETRTVQITEAMHQLTTRRLGSENVSAHELVKC